METIAKDHPGEILVVDDRPENLVAIEAALSGFGGNLVFATSGEEALRYLLERNFALILLDVQMPSMDGLETARMIRQRDRTRHVPIIFVTAHDRNDDDVLAAYRLGAVDFLFKPISAEILRAKASVFVELQRRTAEVARQALQIKEHEQAVRERALAAQRRQLEAEALRKRLTEQKVHTDTLTKKNAELEHIRAQLEESNSRLAAADRRKDEFIAVLAHELRNPLAALVSGVELLGVNPAAKQVEVVRPIMQRQCQHLNRLVDDLLDVSRITSGKMKLRREKVRLRDVIDDAVKLASSGIETKNHTLDVSCDCDEVVVDGDPIRLAQIIANLLSNAARYTDAGGRIWLSAQQHNGTVTVGVKDNGRGMSKELAARVFDMFVQAETGSGGLGIGLTLVRELTQMHGGRVAAQSDGPGMGSVFSITLPAQPAGERARRVSTMPPTAEQPVLRIALIDDHDDVREMTRSVLEEWGHTVLEASTGLDGVTLVLSEKPDVAIVDIGLPDIEGYEVARRVRAELTADSCPRLIALTGFGQPNDRERAYQAGFHLHLSKPAESAALRAALYDPTIK